MKDKKLKKLIQKPLRFHHQDIHEELDTIRDLLARIVINIEDIRTTLKETRDEITVALRPQAGGQAAENRAEAGELPHTEDSTSR
jgi:hypothetical protein